MPVTERQLGADPTPRTLEQMYRELKALEDKFNIRFAAYDESVRLLQDFANRQPTTESVNGDVRALKELTAAQLSALKELVSTMFEGNKTALGAALDTRKEATDEIKVAFAKQFENLQKMIDDLKDRLNRSEGRGTGRNDIIAWIVAAIAVAGFLITNIPRA